LRPSSPTLPSPATFQSSEAMPMPSLAMLVPWPATLMPSTPML
jgi:hypothetical protein